MLLYKYPWILLWKLLFLANNIEMFALGYLVQPITSRWNFCTIVSQTFSLKTLISNKMLAGELSLRPFDFLLESFLFTAQITFIKAWTSQLSIYFLFCVNVYVRSWFVIKRIKSNKSYGNSTFRFNQLSISFSHQDLRCYGVGNKILITAATQGKYFNFFTKHSGLSSWSFIY